MINKLFSKKRPLNNATFIEELLHKEFDESLVTEILEKKHVNINFQNTDGDSFLHICLKNLKFKSSLWLIQSGIDVTLSNNEGKTPFDIAIQRQNHRIVKVLLALDKQHIDKKDQFGRTHLQDSVVLGDNEMAEILIEAGADINSKDSKERNVLFDALSYGNEKFIDYLLAKKDLDLDNLDINGDSIMHHTSVYTNDALAKKLIDRGISTTLKNKDGDTYLCKTALRGMEAVDLIDAALKKGSDINARVSHNKSILMEIISSASKLSDVEKERRESLLNMSSELVLKGIDVNALDENNESVLFKAARANDFDLVSFLLNSNVDLNIQNKQYETALSMVAYKGVESLDIFLLLVKNGANPCVKNKKGQTLYEILNSFVLHTHSKKDLKDESLLKKVRQDGQYMLLIKEMLSCNKQDLDILDSKGQPLFFDPLLYDHYPLFKLYIKAGLNIHNTNILRHNIFFEYVLKVFTDNNEKIDFQNNISMLLSAKVNHNYQDETGWTVVNKIIGTPCNPHLFNILVQVVLFDYKITDKLGRSVIHTAVWSDKRHVIRKIDEINHAIISLPDNYGILPVTYAALLGNYELVSLFIDLGANIKSGVDISKAAIKKFEPMLKNLKKLEDLASNQCESQKMQTVIDQVKRDFRTKDSEK